LLIVLPSEYVPAGHDVVVAASVPFVYGIKVIPTPQEPPEQKTETALTGLPIGVHGPVGVGPNERDIVTGVSALPQEH